MNFNVGLTGISAAQGALKVTQQNIANISTDGYIRQKAIFEEIGVGSDKGVMAKTGAGVEIKDVLMVMDNVLINNFNGQNSIVNYYNELEGILYETETVLGDYTDGSLGDMLEGFFQSWEEFSKFPEESSYRFSMLGEASKLVSKINEMGSQLSRLESEADSSTNNYIDKINELTKTLASINNKVNIAGEHTPNELVNERLKLIEELSGFIDIDVKYDGENPNLAVIRAGGAFLVSGTENYELKLYENNDTAFVGNGLTRVDFKNGVLGASMSVKENYLAPYRKDLETFVRDLKTALNDIHKDGYSMTGETGYDFFVGNSAKTIAINPELLMDSSKIASSALPSVEGNTDVAAKIGKLINQEYKEGMTYMGYINGFSMGMAQDLKTVTNQQTIQTQVLAGMEAQKESLQGVNLEEEMANLLMYQQMYQANAKTINMVQKVMDSIMEILR